MLLPNKSPTQQETGMLLCCPEGMHKLIGAGIVVQIPLMLHIPVHQGVEADVF